MLSTVNYIDASERKFIEPGYFATLSGGLWNSDATISADPITYQDFSFGSIFVDAVAESETTYNIWSNPATDIPSQYAITLDVENTDYIEAFCWVRPTKNCTISISTQLTEVYLDETTNDFMLSSDSEDVYQGATGNHTIAVGIADEPIWHLVKAKLIQIPSDDAQYSIGLKISAVFDDETSPGELNISRPTIIRTHAIFFNEALQETYIFIPDVFLDRDTADFTSNEVTYPLMRLIDVATDTAHHVAQKIDEIQYLDIESGFDSTDSETYSTLINPSYSDVPTLEWLSQFRGRNLVVTYEPSTEGEEWQQFVLDSSTLDGTDVIATATPSTSGISGGVEEYFRWQVQTGNYGHNAGTISAMISAVQLFLTGEKTINYSTTPTNIYIETSITETYGSDDLSIGDANPYILEIIEPARPLGMTVTHVLTA